MRPARGWAQLLGLVCLAASGVQLALAQAPQQQLLPESCTLTAELEPRYICTVAPGRPLRLGANAALLSQSPRATFIGDGGYPTLELGPDLVLPSGEQPVPCAMQP